MVNHWAITIGINQYQHLQPLMHAQNDALSVHRFLIEDAGVSPEQCVLLSDLATSVGHQAVYPDKPALAEWIQTITQQVGPDDRLWIFFSGYGAQLDGADYLMPIDGESSSPEQLRATGIAIASLIETLAKLPTAKTLLILDINRSQGALAGQTIGTEAIALAEQHQVPLLLSCQPEQYSHETFGVRHGLFTAALLEALQPSATSRRTTYSQISTYLIKRLPELCEHHWRPLQNPVSIFPSGQADSVIVPETFITTTAQSTQTQVEKATAEPVTTGQMFAAGAAATVGVAAGTASTAGQSATGSLPIAGNGFTMQSPLSQAASNSQDRMESATAAQGKKGTAALSSTAIVPVKSTAIVAPSQPETEPSGGISGTKLRNWGLFALALLMGAVLLKQQPSVKAAFSGLGERFAQLGANRRKGAGDGAEQNVAPETLPAEGTAVLPVESEQTTAKAGSTTNAENIAGKSQTPTETESSESQNPEKITVQPNATQPAKTQANASEQTNAEAQAAASALITKANAAIGQRQYSEALITLQQVPQPYRDVQFSTALTKARAGSAQAQQSNAALLTDALTEIQSAQASQFTDAIAKARQIKPGEPYYEQAQEDIRSWSSTILDIAEGRATAGNLQGAIAAAQVMPYDNAEFRQKSQDRIAFWQQRQRSRQVIEDAKKIPKSGQASTYQKGIVKLQEIPIEHPEYEIAQRLSDEWSQRIFSIAQARAAQGRQSAAIQAAILVPAGTTAYEPTQQAIRRWRLEQTD